MNEQQDPLLNTKSTTTTTTTTETSNQIEQIQINQNQNQIRQNQINKTNLNSDAILFKNLRSEAEELGLDSESLGWAIIQSIHSGQPIGKSQTTYASIIEPLMSIDQSIGLILLLPKEKIHWDYELNKDIFLNHILLTTPPHQSNHLSDSSSELYLSNLNGWKGLLKSELLVFTSPGEPISLNQINDIDSRFILSKVKPSTTISNEVISPSQLRFPSYNLISRGDKRITIPRLNGSVTTRGSAAKRLASLFTTKAETEPLTITVRVCDRALDSLQLDQSISKAVSSRITDGLGSLEENVLQIILNFIQRFSLYLNPSSSDSDSNSYSHGSLHHASYEEIAQEIQEMYRKIDQELEQEYQEEIGSGGNDEEKRMIIDHTLELIEEVVCLELFDRLFEDNVQDEKLSEKIAQLNLLDVSL